jgi:type IV secretory pathway TraG/TraD family ATPase VirD4
MTDVDKRQLSLAVCLLLPFGSWFFVSHKLGLIQKGHFFGGIIDAAGATPHSWLLAGTPVVVFIAAVFGLRFLFKFTKSEFTGAAFTKFHRGTEIVGADKLKRKTLAKKAQQITVAGVPMPLKLENLHLLVGGSTGAGKSVCIREVAFGAFMRGDRMIITDPNGEMLSKFYRKGDIILNPYDSRSAGWSFFNEIRSDYDFKRFALSIVPRGQSADAEEWASYGRLLLTETARKLALIGDPSIESLYRWTTIEDPKKLKEFLKDTLAESLFVGAEKALASARFVLSAKLPEHVSMPAGRFSIRSWLDDEKAGNLFITWREDQAESLKPLISAWVDTICSSVLSMSENEKRRIWLFLDELGSLEKLASLEAALTKGRKYGLRVVAGLQTTAQLDRIFGRDEGQIIRACFRNVAILGGSKLDTDTAEEFSKALGNHQVEREQTTYSNNGRSTSARPDNERVVTPEQIVTLPDLTGYLGFASDLPIARFKLNILRLKTVVPGFVERSLADAEIDPASGAVDA